MSVRAMEGTCLAALVRMAIPVCKAAEKQCPRSGPGRRPDYADWQITVLIMIAILARRKSKSAQYRFLYEHRHELQEWLNLSGHFPARSTYFQRYRRAHRPFQAAIAEQGRKAIREGVADATTVAVDKSLIRARGPEWHHKDRRRGTIPKRLHGVDRDSTWTYSEHHRWVQGYAYEVVVSAGKRGITMPLLASAATANVSEHVSFGPKIKQLPKQVRNVLADAGYDNNRYGDEIEYASDGHLTGRRFVCARNRRSTPKRRATSRVSKPVLAARQRRQRRFQFFTGPAGQRLRSRRAQTVEPFNEWFKSLFELDHRAWHRGLANNRTQILGALCCYQLLVRFNHRRGHHNGRVKWMLDTL